MPDKVLIHGQGDICQQEWCFGKRPDSHRFLTAKRLSAWLVVDYSNAVCYKCKVAEIVVTFF